MSKNENRLNFRMTDETATKIERWYQVDNCRSKNEFIEKAVNCYADMLAAGESATLPRAVQSAIDSRLKLFEDRIVALLYKQTVEMDMAMSILLQSLNVSEEVLRQERAKSIAAVKRTNGQLRLEQISVIRARRPSPSDYTFPVTPLPSMCVCWRSAGSSSRSVLKSSQRTTSRKTAACSTR